MKEHNLRTGIKAAAVPSLIWSLALLGGCLAWSYSSTIVELFEFWLRNEDYSVGMLVPLVALHLVWRKRRELAEISISPAWSGLCLLAAAEAGRLFGVRMGLESAQRYSLVLAIAGLVLLATGKRMFWHLRWVLLLLVLMVPLPFRVHEAVAMPLQNAATTMTVFGLETAGFYVVREGNVLRINDTTIVAVTEACSGLRMLTAFVIVAAVLAFMANCATWQRAALVILSVPIAVLSNGLRGFATAYLMCYSKSESLTENIHDIAGWAMMPLALLLSLGALRLMKTLDAASSTGSVSKQVANKIPHRRMKVARYRARSSV